MKLSSERFGTINIAKGEDDGTVFRNFIRESRRGSDRRNLATDAIVEMLEKGKVSPFEWFRCTTPPNIALRSSSPFALRCVPANHTESHSIHNHHRIRSLPSSPWRFPSSPVSSPWPSQMGSVWTAECAYTHFLVIKSAFNAVNVGSVPRFPVPQNLRAKSRAWSAGHSTERSRALSFGHIVCARSYHPLLFCAYYQSSVGCLSAVLLPRRF